MALTRAQLLMGNDSQGAVLPGEVQGVKQGAGILIATDGTISVDASSVVGLVKLNNAAAFNGYVWPSVSGSPGQVLTKGTGNLLEWTNGGVFVSPTAPVNPEIGDLWFDCTVGELLVYEACTSGAPKWTGGAAGLPVSPANTSASPAFASGSGTLASPYICTASSASIGGIVVVNRVTVTDLAPFQFVQIVDLNGVVNGGRFSASNNVANASGILVFDILFNDSPTSPVGTIYTCALKIGIGTVYVNAPVTLTDVFSLNSPGSISGSGLIGSALTYTTGTAAGGAAPYVYTWVWKKFSDNTVLQTNGATYTPGTGLFGETIVVTLTAQDAAGQVVSGTTAEFGPISKPPFPNPTPPTIPTAVGQDSSFAWDGAPTTLSSDGCLLFSVAAGPFSQGPTAVTTGNTVATRWSNTGPCGLATSGTEIVGCLFDTSFSACGSLVIDRSPDAFAFDPEGNIPPGTVATSTLITPTGYNTPAYITVGSGSTGSNYEAKIGAGSFVAVPNSGVYSLLITPGNTLAVRFTVGPTALTDYFFNVQIGDSSGNTSAIFTAESGSAGFPTTPISFPTAVQGSGSVATSVAWGNGSTNISATGCIEFSVDGGTTFTQVSTAITDGVQLRTRYISSALCANNTTGTTISGSITNTTFTETGSLQIDRVPNTVTFNTVSGATISTVYTSNVTTPSGYNGLGYVTLAAGATLTSVQANVNNTGFVAVPATGATTMPILPGQTLQIRATTGGSFSTNYTATIELGVTGNVTTSPWTVEVGVAVPAIATPSITTPANGATAVGTSAGVTITSSGYSASGGAGGHASSSWEVYAANELAPETSAITAITSTPVFSTTIDRSVRFVNSQQNYLERFVSANSNRRKWTWSCWIKKSSLAVAQGLFVGGNVTQDQINFQLDNGSNKIAFTDVVANVTVANLVTTATYTDCTEWFNIVLAVDTTSVVSSNRIKLYVNNQLISAFDTALYYAQNADTSLNSATPFRIGVNGITIGNYLSSYLASVTFVDGLALTSSSFGVLSGTDWVPVDYSGSFGTNGFKLGFSTNPTAFISPTSLGKDTSGNNNDFNPYGLFTGNTAFDTSIGWFLPNPPGTYSYLGVGQGGSGGPAGPNNPGQCTGGGGGGGGGVISGSKGVAALTAIQLPQQASNGSITFDSFTGGKGANGTLLCGGTSGSPQSCPGIGPGSSSGGGGAGGAATGQPGGPGISSSITGISIQYGTGGRGGNGGGEGYPGDGGANGIGSCFVIGVSSTNSGATYGAALPIVKGVNNGVCSYVFQTAYSTSNLVLNNDWLLDTPTPSGTDTGAGGQVTGNYAILNPARSTVTTVNGNLDYFSAVSAGVLASLEISGGKYYWEVQPRLGVALTGAMGIAQSSVAGSGGRPGSITGSYAYDLTNGQTVTNATGFSYGTAFAANDVIGIAFDANDGKLYFAKNNVYQNGSNPLTSLNPAFSGLTSGPYLPAFGGNTLGNGFSVNFGARPFVYNAPTGYKVLVENPTILALELTDDQSLADFQVGDVVAEVGGDATGVAAAIDLLTNTISVSDVVGTWTIGSSVIDNSRTVPVGPPTTDPPDPLNYFLIASVANSTIDLTSFSVAKPPLDPLVTYFTHVKYKSSAAVTESSYSGWSGFTTGTLT